MTIKIVVLYPNPEGATFDMDYYLATHMPLVSESWSQYGLKGWEVVQFGPGGDGARPSHSVQATLVWDNQEDVGKAMGGPEAAKVMGDVPNFSNQQPVLLGGQVVKTHTH